MTVLGLHSQAEVDELIQIYDSRARALQDSFNAISAKWATANKAERDDFASDLTKWNRRWEGGKVAAKAAGLVETSAISRLAPASLQANESGYQILLHAITATPGNYQKGDFQDLYNRLDAHPESQVAAALNKTVGLPGGKPLESTRATDFDSGFIQDANMAGKTGTTLGLTTLAIGGAALAILAGLAYTKRY